MYPGGAVNRNETFEEAFRRETAKEAGIILNPMRHKLFPIARYITSPDVSGVRHDLLIFVSSYKALRLHIVPVGDIVDFGWFSPEDAVTRAYSGKMKISDSGNSVVPSSFHLTILQVPRPLTLISVQLW